MIIHPEIYATPDSPTVKFREPRDQIDLEIELPKILHSQGWDCGTYFHVQFVSHDKKKLLSSATFVVSEIDETLHTNEDNPYSPVTKTVFHRKAQQIGDWWNSGEVKAAIVRWNPGKKVHQVIENDKVIYESPDKQQAVKVAEAA